MVQSRGKPWGELKPQVGGSSPPGRVQSEISVLPCIVASQDPMTVLGGTIP